MTSNGHAEERQYKKLI